MAAGIHARFLETAGAIASRLREGIARVGPVRLSRRDDVPLAEYLCRAVAGQQLSVKAAATIWGRVVDSSGRRPLVEHLRTVDPGTLRACGLSASKARAMREIAETARRGTLDERALARAEHERRVEMLTEIWGVGRWTADMCGIFWFGDRDIWPDGDGAARGKLQELIGRRRSTVRVAGRFAPHRSYLAIYMWRLIGAPPTDD